MKQFTFPLSIKCASVEERDECIKLLKSIGYKTEDIDDLLGVTNVYGEIGICTTIVDSAIYLDGNYHIDHFNPDLIRDIASVCTNDTWQKGEPWVYNGIVKYSTPNNKGGGIIHWVGENVVFNSARRPTLAEICEYYGYEIKGRDIVKKEEKISNCDKSYCATSMRLDEAISEINRLKSENAELKEKLKAVADVDNQELERLRSEKAELKVKYKMFQEAYNTARNREIKLKDCLIDIASDMD